MLLAGTTGIIRNWVGRKASRRALHGMIPVNLKCPGLRDAHLGFRVLCTGCEDL